MYAIRSYYVLVVTPMALFFLGEWAMESWFLSGVTKSQESFGGYRRFFSRGKYRCSTMQWIFRKEAKLFLRDSAEWSQLFMIAALVVVYLYNFKVLPVERSMFARITSYNVCYTKLLRLPKRHLHYLQ